MVVVVVMGEVVEVDSGAVGWEEEGWEVEVGRPWALEVVKPLAEDVEMYSMSSYW